MSGHNPAYAGPRVQIAPPQPILARLGVRLIIRQGTTFQSVGETAITAVGPDVLGRQYRFGLPLAILRVDPRATEHHHREKQIKQHIKMLKVEMSP